MDKDARIYIAQAMPDGPVIWQSTRENSRDQVDPLLTFVNSWGGRLQVIQDDSQYVLLVQHDEVYTATFWWPLEVIQAVATLRERAH